MRVETFELYVTDRYDNEPISTMWFTPLPHSCDALRINMVAQPNAAVGILEVQVAFEK